MDQIIDHISPAAEKVAQDLKFSKSAPDMASERALARDMVSSMGPLKEHWQLIFDTIACGVVVFSALKQIVEINRAAQQILGGDLVTMQQHLFSRGQNVFSHPDGTPLPQDERMVSAVFRTGQAQQDALEGYMRPDGQQRWLQVDAVPICGEDDTTTHAVITFVDVTERVEAEKAIQASEARFRALTEQSNDLTAIIDAEGCFKYASPSYRRILGYEPEELVGTSMFSMIHPDDLLQMLKIFAEGRPVSGPPMRAESRVLRKDGSWLTVDGVSHRCFDDPAIRGMVITGRDITERVAMEEAMRYQMLYDGLTGLPNSNRFIEVLEQEIIAAQREQKTMAVLVLDIDRFKDVNDTFGHQHGDILLQQVGIRLRDIVPNHDTVSRLSGDEFAILLLEADEARAQEVASAIHHALEEPCMVEGYPVQVDLSIGCSLYPTHASDGITLLRRADMTMYTVKQTHAGYALFDEAFEQHDPRRLALIAELRRAIPAGELRLYYQPKLDLNTRLVGSVEALVRWQHPTYGLIPPDQFIALAEQTGLIKPLTHWVLEEGVRQCGKWLRDGRGLRVAVNLSAWNLREATLLETITALLARYHVPARLLCIELTESAMMTNMQRSRDILAQIFALGVHISIDDFGTGYSSLAYLKHLPIDELKIDRSFVQQMTTSSADATIVRSTVNLAHNFGMRVVAEGVEDQTTLDLLTMLHCDLAQGYYISRPLPLEEFERWPGDVSPVANSLCGVL